MSNSLQPGPAVHVKNRLGLEAVRKACAEWVALDPVEVKRWRLDQEAIRQVHEWTGGWSQSREFLALGMAPSFVIFRTIQLLRKAGWDVDEARTWDTTNRGGKTCPSDLWNAAIAELLPEMKTARKERVQRFHHGVDLLPARPAGNGESHAPSAVPFHLGGGSQAP